MLSGGTTEMGSLLGRFWKESECRVRGNSGLGWPDCDKDGGNGPINRGKSIAFWNPVKAEF